MAKGRIDPATGRNKRDKCTQRDEKKASPERKSDGSGKIKSRAASGRKMAIERALRRRAR